MASWKKLIYSGSEAELYSVQLSSTSSYTDDFSTNYDDRTLVDKGWVDSVTGSFASSISGTATYIPRFTSGGNNIEDSIASASADTFHISGALEISNGDTNIFGSLITDRHEFTGSVYITGSISYIDDHSLSYTNRSLVDKGWVDSITGSLGTGNVTTSDTLTDNHVIVGNGGVDVGLANGSVNFNNQGITNINNIILNGTGNAVRTNTTNTGTLGSTSIYWGKGYINDITASNGIWISRATPIHDNDAVNKGWVDSITGSLESDLTGTNVVSASSTDLDNEVAVFVNGNYIEGNSNFTFDTNVLTVAGTIIAGTTTNGARIASTGNLTITDSGAIKVVLNPNATGTGNSDAFLFNTVDTAVGGDRLISLKNNDVQNFYVDWTGSLGLFSTASYESDYSSFYNDRSLVDKGWVDSVTGSFGTGNGTVTNAGSFTDNYVIVGNGGVEISIADSTINFASQNVTNVQSISLNAGSTLSGNSTSVISSFDDIQSTFMTASSGIWLGRATPIHDNDGVNKGWVDSITGSFGDVTADGTLSDDYLMVGFGGTSIGIPDASVNFNGQPITNVGNITATGEFIRLGYGTTLANPFLSFYEGTTRRAYVQYHTTDHVLRLSVDEPAGEIELKEHANCISGMTATSYTGSTKAPFRAEFSGVYGEFGPKNSSYCHFYTDTLAGFYMDDKLEINGNVEPYSNGAYNLGTSTDTWNSLYAEFIYVHAESTAGDPVIRFQQSTTTRGTIYYDDTYDGMCFNAGSTTTTSVPAIHIGLTYNHVAIGTTVDSSTYELYVAGDIYATGNVTAYSDIRFKDVKEKLNGVLKHYEKIDPILYAWKKGEGKDGLQYGFSAQEVQKQFPHAVVVDNEDGKLSINIMAMTALNASAIKETKTELDELKERVKELEKKLKKLGK